MTPGSMTPRLASSRPPRSELSWRGLGLSRLKSIDEDRPAEVDEDSAHFRFHRGLNRIGGHSRYGPEGQPESPLGPTTARCDAGRRAKSLLFKVTVTLGGKTFTTKLKLKKPKK